MHVIIFFLGPHLWHMEVPRLEVQSELRRRPTPEPQQLGIQAESATYTTTHSNVWSLTHWVRPGIEPESSWMLLGFTNHWAMTETPNCALLDVCRLYANYISIKLFFNCFFLSFFSLFWPHLQHRKVPGPGIRLQPTPQLWKWQILNLLYHSGNSFLLF